MDIHSDSCPGMVILTQTAPITAIWMPRLTEVPTDPLTHTVAPAGVAELGDVGVSKSFPTPNSRILVLWGRVLPERGQVFGRQRSSRCSLAFS